MDIFGKVAYDQFFFLKITRKVDVLLSKSCYHKNENATVAMLLLLT